MVKSHLLFNRWLYINVNSRDHSELTTISNDMVIGELKWTELAIKEVIGVTPRLMRPVNIYSIE